MSVLDFIERLREQPVSERRRWALSIALGVTLFIALIWLTSLAMGLSSVTEEAETNKQKSLESETPFETITESIGDAWGGVEKAIKAFGTIEYLPKEEGLSTSTNSKESQF